MNVLHLKDTSNKVINAFNSQQAISHLLMKENENFQLSVIELGPNGILGLHQAKTDQICFALKGNGWIKDQSKSVIPITDGDSIFWKKGEWHETGTELGLQMLIIEGIDLFSSKNGSF